MFLEAAEDFRQMFSQLLTVQGVWTVSLYLVISYSICNSNVVFEALKREKNEVEGILIFFEVTLKSYLEKAIYFWALSVLDMQIHVAAMGVMQKKKVI